jgi:SAM-dependent methyltransferase
MRENNLARLSNLEIDEGHSEFLIYKFLLNDLKETLAKYTSGSVLDIGCGNKPYEVYLSPAVTKYVGCDIVQSSKECVEIICDAGSIPLEDSIFETVLSTQTIEHVENHQGLVNEAFRLLKNEGHFIVSGPLYWPLHEEPYDFFRFTKHGFRYILEKAGFTIVEERSNGGKWALAGQALIHAIYPDIYIKRSFGAKILRALLHKAGGLRFMNKIFSRLDDKFYDERNTMNYVIVARK